MSISMPEERCPRRTLWRSEKQRDSSSYHLRNVKVANSDAGTEARLRLPFHVAVERTFRAWQYRARSRMPGRLLLLLADRNFVKRFARIRMSFYSCIDLNRIQMNVTQHNKEKGWFFRLHFFCFGRLEWVKRHLCLDVVIWPQMTWILENRIQINIQIQFTLLLLNCIWLSGCGIQ